MHAIPITSVTVKALEQFDITRKDAERAKNMFALGLLSWLYNRPVEGTMRFLESKFATKPEIMEANKAAFQAGWNYGETTEAFSVQYEVKPAALTPGTYRNITGNDGAVLRPGRGLPPVAAAAVPGRLPDHPGLGHPARAVQAQAVRSAHVPGRGRDRRRGRGARRVVRRRPGRDHDLGPGHVPQGGDDRPGRLGGAAADRLRHPAGRAVHGHADQDRAGRPADGAVRPQRRVAGGDRRALRPRRDCFDTAIEAVRIAVKYRTPVIILSDGYLANGSEPWRIPDVGGLPRLRDEFSFASPPPAPGARGLPALPARPGDAGPAVGHPGHARPGAPDRRHREGRRDRHDLL